MIMTIKRRKFAAAFTLVEVAMAFVIVTIVIVGCSMLFVTGRYHITQQKNYRTATCLASQRLDELKAGSYGDIAEGSSDEDINFDSTSYTRNTNTVDDGTYKTVWVTVSWPGKTDPSVSLVTIIAP